MIPYRRQRAIESGSGSLLAADLTIGDTVLIRRPDCVNRSAEIVTGIHPGKTVTIHFQGFTHDTSPDVPIGVQSFTTGGWRQYVPEFA